MLAVPENSLLHSYFTEGPRADVLLCCHNLFGTHDLPGAHERPYFGAFHHLFVYEDLPLARAKQTRIRMFSMQGNWLVGCIGLSMLKIIINNARILVAPLLRAALGRNFSMALHHPTTSTD